MYTIQFTYQAYNKIRLYIDLVDTEISGLGKIKKDDFTNKFIIEDVTLINQINTGSTTELSEEGVGKFIAGLEKKGENAADWRLWWHSHANFGVFWSGVDENTIENFDNQRTDNNYALAVVGNKKGEFKCRVDCWQPIRATIDDLEWSIGEDDEKLEKKIKAEIKAKIKKPLQSNPYRRSYQNNLPTVYEDERRDDYNGEEELRDWYWREFTGQRKFKAYTQKEIAEIKGFCLGLDFNSIFKKSKSGLWYPVKPKRDYNIEIQ